MLFCLVQRSEKTIQAGYDTVKDAVDELEAAKGSEVLKEEERSYSTELLALKYKDLVVFVSVVTSEKGVQAGVCTVKDADDELKSCGVS